VRPVDSAIPTNLPVPLGAYKAVVVRGGVGYVSGQFPIRDGQVVQPGRLGDTLGIDAGREAARVAALNVLGQIRSAVPNGLERVELARVDGYIACVPEFVGLPRVLDAASETFVEHLGDRGKHARGLVPVDSLPGSAAIELLVVFHIPA
jgi:enamine deaminase RidA (YjgF/YER057c/UK114 family)